MKLASRRVESQVGAVEAESDRQDAVNPVGSGVGDAGGGAAPQRGPARV